MEKINLDSITTYELLEKIKNLSNNEKLELYNNVNIRNKINNIFHEVMGDNRWLYFKELVSALGIKKIFEICGYNNIINYLKTDKIGNDIFLDTLIRDDSNLTYQYIERNEELFKIFIENLPHIYRAMDSLIYENIIRIITKAKALNLNINYEFVNVLDDESQKKLLLEDFDTATIIEIIKNMSVKNQKDFFLNDERAKELYINFDINELNENFINFNKDSVCEDSFFNKLKSRNINKMRKNINIIEVLNPSLILEERMSKYIDYLVNNYDKDITINTLGEVISIGIFHDTYKNVCLNIKELLRFNKYLDKGLSEEDLSFYNQVIHLEELDTAKQKDFFNKYKDSNINTKFYMDLRRLKDKSYTLIKNSLYKANDNMKIYDLRNEEYIMLVRCLDRPFTEKANSYRDCYTLISNRNNAVFRDTGYIYGYDNFDINKVIHVSESDTGSNRLSEYDRVNRIMLPEEIIYTRNKVLYNEIQIINDKNSNGYISKRPSYIICYEDVSSKELEESKRLNIPIMVINKRVYSYEDEEISEEKYEI